jgi:DNA-directed RNA polymerase subunit RPC12/RpoP
MKKKQVEMAIHRCVWCDTPMLVPFRSIEDRTQICTGCLSEIEGDEVDDVIGLAQERDFAREQEEVEIALKRISCAFCGAEPSIPNPEFAGVCPRCELRMEDHDM